MADGFTSRVSRKAESFTFVRVLLAVLVSPFWLVGAVVAVLWLVVRWMIAAAQVGFADVLARAGQQRPIRPAGDA